MNNAEEMAVGQIWECNDSKDRGGGVRRHVIEIANGIARMEDVATGRKTNVRCGLFLRRQGRRNGYALVSREPKEQ